MRFAAFLFVHVHTLGLFLLGVILVSNVKTLTGENMLYQRETLLIKRYRKLGWTSKDVANLWGCSPGTASSKLNGFIILKSDELRSLTEAMAAEEQKRARETMCNHNQKEE
jgi:hypothetical protein